MNKKLIFIILILSSFCFGQKINQMTQGHGVPWGLVFLDKENLLFTERDGGFKILNIKTRRVQEVSTKIPVKTGGQAGLLDVQIDPEFGKNQKIYFTYSKVIQGKHTTALGMAHLQQEKKEWVLTPFKDLFVAKPSGSEKIHYGSRIVVTDKEIWMTVGERNQRDLAQDLSTHLGKLLRLDHEGKALQDNPFVGRKNAQPEIWSYGHRNPQGLLKHPVTSEIWLHEHGPRGGDEINLIKKGANYGWPIVSYGREYWGPKISDSPTKKGIEGPIYQYTPSIAPSGFEYYSGSRISAFKNSFLIGSLVLTHLNQIILKENGSPQEKRYFEKKGFRVRDVIMGPDELVYFSTDAGEIWQVQP